MKKVPLVVLGLVAVSVVANVSFSEDKTHDEAQGHIHVDHATTGETAITSAIEGSPDALELKPLILGAAVMRGTTADSTVAGTVSFLETEEGLKIDVIVSGIPTPGKHGIHIHENGSCEDSGNAAGGHYNPDGVQHGFVLETGAGTVHPGDLGNITIDESGNGTLSVVVPGLGLKNGHHLIDGKSIILHERQDDGSQPTGNAGGRIGCGLINVVE